MVFQKCDSGKAPQGNPYLQCNEIACSSVNPFINDYVPEIVPSDHSGKGLFGLQSNFIGPYTHAAAFTCSGGKQTRVEGDNWGGGSEWFGLGGNNNQIYPFPIYYYTRFLGAIHGDVEPYKSFDKNSTFASCNPKDFVDAFNKSDKQALITEINKINTNIIKPAVQFAIDTTNQALKELQNDNLIDNSLQPLTLDKILYQEKDKLWGIPPSAASANTLYNYYYTLSDSDRAQQQKQFSEKIKNCKVGTNTSLANMSVYSKFNLNLVDIAKTWLISFVGDENDKNLQEQRLIDCPATLIITSGETTCGICEGQKLNNNTPEVGKICCENQQNGGIWQITSPDSPAISYTSDGCNEKTLSQNICCNADYVNTHLYTNDAYKVASFGMFPGDAPIGQCSPCQTGQYPNCEDPFCTEEIEEDSKVNLTNSTKSNESKLWIIILLLGILFIVGSISSYFRFKLIITLIFLGIGLTFLTTSIILYKNQQAPPTPATKWACNSSDGTCAVDPNGTFNSPQDCMVSCKKPVPPTPDTKWACNSSDGTCAVDPNGTFNSQQDCEVSCKKPDPQKCPSGTVYCAQNKKCVRCRQKIPPKPVPSGNWDSAWFYSGGKDKSGNFAPYTNNMFGQVFNATVKENNFISSNGADPSCGGGDPQTINKCNPKIKYQMQGGSTLCQMGPNKGSSGIQLVGDKGKVATLIHGQLGDWDYKTCTTGSFLPSFNSRALKIQKIMQMCDAGTNKKYVQKIQQSGDGKYQCLITNQALKDSGLYSMIQDSQPANVGVVLAFGHGLGYGKCGNFTFIKQGNNFSGVQNPNPNENQIILNMQIGTRSWSGEIGDSWDTIEPSKQGMSSSYLTKGINDPQDACFQPLFKEIPDESIDALLNLLVPTPSGKSLTGNFAGLMGWAMPAAGADNLDSANNSMSKLQGLLTKDKIVGIWCGSGCNDWNPTAPKQAPCSVKITSGNTIALGSFQYGLVGVNANCSKNFTNKWYTMGGQGVDPKQAESFDATAIIKQADSMNTNIVCFDMEGPYSDCAKPGWFSKNMLNKLKKLIDDIRTQRKDFIFVLCPLGDIGPNGPSDGTKWLAGQIPYMPTFAETKDHFDYVCPMLYWGDTTYNLVDSERIGMWIADWINPDVGGYPPERIILTWEDTALIKKPSWDVLTFLANITKGAQSVTVGPNPLQTPTDCSGGGSGGGGTNCYCPKGIKCGGDCSVGSQGKASCDTLKAWKCQWKS